MSEVVSMTSEHLDPCKDAEWAWSVTLPDVAATQAWGKALGESVRGAVCVALHGDLGAGKTTFAQGVGAALKVDGDVVSPTFSLIDEHEGEIPLLHADAYRLEPGEAEGIGLEEALEDWPGVSLVEWASRVSACLPIDGIDVELTIMDDSHRGHARARGAAGAVVLDAWRRAWSRLNHGQ